MPLRVRLGLLYGSLLAVTLVTFATLLYVVLLTNLSRQMDAQLRLQATQVEQQLHLGPDGHLGPEDIPPQRLGLPALNEADAPGLVTQVLDERGRVIANSNPGVRGVLVAALAVPAADAGDTVLEMANADGDHLRALVHPILADGRLVGSIQVAASQEPTLATMANVLRLLALGTLIALCLMTVAAWWLSGRALAPLRRITSKARSIAQTGEIGERLQVDTERDEVGQLATAFNAMIERLDESARRQLAFLADTSHELRSPLTVLRGNLDLMRRDPERAARSEYLKEADAEARRMARLVGDLLLLAQSDASHSVQLAPVALETVVRAVYEQALMLAEGPAVEASCDVHARVLGDADRLKQMLWNLVENALRHTPNEGCVRIALTVEGHEAVVRVVDSGEGIAPEHLPHVFERFYKADRARSRVKGGTGLGLAIVRHLADAHNGRVDLASTVGVGTTATVRLPLAINGDG